jgi:hypothetical protein
MSDNPFIFEDPGGGIGFIPEKIDEPTKRHLKDFPTNFYVGFIKFPVPGHKDSQGRTSLKTLFEIFDPHFNSYEETESEKILHYQCFNDADKTIIARLGKVSGGWTIEQFEKNKRVRYSTGSDYRTAMIHATLVIAYT